MKTCAFCGSEININFCDFCDMELEEKYILVNGERLAQYKDFKGYPDHSLIFSSTKELMKLETIELLCLLREARSHRANVFNLRLLRHKAEEQEGYTEQVSDLAVKTYSEYEIATRKVWVIENIIKDRIGYYPQRVTKNFLSMFLDRMKKCETKKMKIKGDQK